MQVTVSNVQLLGAVDGLRAKIDALLDAVGSAHPEILGVDATRGGGATNGTPNTADASAAPKVKRTRAKSAYNIHMSEELARLKDQEPELGHRERFAMAVASWKKIMAERSSAGTSDAADDDAQEVV